MRLLSRATWFQKLPYDIERDFQPIALVARGQCCSPSRRSLPLGSVKELIDYARQNPGKLTNASSSNGSPGHVGAELFKYMTGTKIVHVPYRGGSLAINDLIAGHVDLMFESLQSIAPFGRDGKVRALAVTGDHRSPSFPDFADRRGSRRAWLCCRHLDRRHRAGWRAATDCRQTERGDQQGAQVGSFPRKFSKFGDEPAGGTPEDFAATIKADSAKWADVVKRSGATLD